MSRQRPYETFEKAFFNYILMKPESTKRLNILIVHMKYFEAQHDFNKDVSMQLPRIVSNDDNICVLWSCLSRLFGDQGPWISECKIPRQNISLTIEYIEDHIQEIVEDEQIEEMLTRGVKND